MRRESYGHWRADMLRVGRQTRALMHRHPWMPGLMPPVYGFSPNTLRYVEHCLVCLDPLEVSYGTKMELVAMVNAVVTTFVTNELATVERARSLPWSQEQENAVRIAYPGGRIASGDYPRLAAVFEEDTGRSTRMRCSSGTADGCSTASAPDTDEGRRAGADRERVRSGPPVRRVRSARAGPPAPPHVRPGPRRARAPTVVRGARPPGATPPA
ncbi:hypothetical protein GCM10027073_20110 [Streptomyces chlorus]